MCQPANHDGTEAILFFLVRDPAVNGKSGIILSLERKNAILAPTNIADILLRILLGDLRSEGSEVRL